MSDQLSVQVANWNLDWKYLTIISTIVSIFSTNLTLHKPSYKRLVNKKPRTEICD